MMLVRSSALARPAKTARRRRSSSPATPARASKHPRASRWPRSCTTTRRSTRTARTSVPARYVSRLLQICLFGGVWVRRPFVCYAVAVIAVACRYVSVYGEADFAFAGALHVVPELHVLHPGAVFLSERENLFNEIAEDAFRSFFSRWTTEII